MTRLEIRSLQQLGPLLATIAVSIVSMSGCTVVAPELCRVQYVDRGPSAPCSAVAVGPHVLLTAAHCVDSTLEREIALLKGGETRKGECDFFEPGEAGEVGDLALCQLDSSSKPFPPEEVETVSTDLARIARRSRLLFTGCGCNEGACGDGTENCPPEGQRGGRLKAYRDPARTSLTFSARSRVFLGKVFISGGDSGAPVCTKDGDWLVGIVRAGCDNNRKSRGVVNNLAAEATVRWMCGWQVGNSDRRIEGLDCPAESTGPTS
jgi:hypothetical protein